MGETSISWTHRPGTVGRSWNPGQGCSRVSAGCQACYAERLAARFAESGWSQGLINLRTGKWNGTVRLAPHKLGEPMRWRQPSTVFVNSMTDMFHEGYSNEQIAAVFGVMAATPQHTYQMLTKRAKRMREWFEWAASDGIVTRTSPALYDATYLNHLASKAGMTGDAWLKHCEGTEDTCSSWPLENLWLGVSVENQEAADERIPELLLTPAAVRFLSCEPLLGPVTLHEDGLDWLTSDHCCGVDWVIAGCESGPGARPCNVEWLRSIRDQCAAAGVPYFLKQAQETDLGRCGDSDNPNGDRPCGRPVKAYVVSHDTAVYSCGCTVEGPEDGVGVPLGAGDGSKRKSGGVIELPYLDGVQHAAFPKAAA
jgi:protein gp37